MKNIKTSLNTHSKLNNVLTFIAAQDNSSIQLVQNGSPTQIILYYIIKKIIVIGLNIISGI